MVIHNQKKFEQEFEKLSVILKNKPIAQGHITQVHFVKNAGDQRYRALRIIQVQYEESDEQFTKYIHSQIDQLLQKNNINNNKIVKIEKIYKFTEYLQEIYQKNKEQILFKNPQDDLHNLGPEPSNEDILCTIVIVTPHFPQGNLLNLQKNFEKKKLFKLILDISEALIQIQKYEMFYDNLRPENIFFLNSNFVLADLGIKQFVDHILLQKLQKYQSPGPILDTIIQVQEKKEVFSLGVVVSRCVLQRDRQIRDFKFSPKLVRDQVDGIKDSDLRNILTHMLDPDELCRWDYKKLVEFVQNI